MPQFLPRSPKPWFVGIVASLAISSSHAFDYGRYQSKSLDAILNQPRPTTGVNLVAPPQKLRLEVKLVNYAEDCNTGLLKSAMVMGGADEEWVEKAPISKCIKVESLQGQTASMYIQNTIATHLSKDALLDAPLTIFVDYLFISENGPGVLVNAFEGTRK
jgi:hypothetical protein